MSAAPGFAPPHGLGAGEDDDETAQDSQMVIAAVWKNATLGLAFMEGTTLRFCQVADGAPEFRQLQAIKYQCKPDVFVIPSTSDVLWTKALKAPVLHVQGGAGCQEDDEEDEGAGDHNAMDSTATMTSARAQTARQRTAHPRSSS
jgi:hypothetical protein